MNINIRCGDLEIRVDRRTELLGILEVISNYRETYPKLLEEKGNKDYLEDIKRRFGKYNNHEVIKLFNEIVNNNNFGYDAPIQLFLQLNDDFTFSNLEDYPFKTRLNSDPKVLKLLKLLPEFSREISFEDFYKNNTSRYQKYINNVKENLGNIDIISFLNSYYNISNNKKFIVNLMAWQTGVNYGTQNDTEIHTNISVFYNSNNDDNVFSSNNKDMNYAYLLYHEFSHSFINPLTEKYNIISDDNTIFSDIFEKMKELAYKDNDTIINEHIIRALTIRWEYLTNHDEELYNKRIEKEKKRGFIYIESILESLIYY